MINKRKTICFVAGKSGGHIIPCLTLAGQRAQHNDERIVFFSTNAPLDMKIIADKSFIENHIALPVAGVSRASILSMVKACWQLFWAFGVSVRQLYGYKRASSGVSVISTGGFVAIPVCLAASLLRIPVYVYELNVVPGKAVKFLAPFATELRICFKKTATFFPGKTCEFTPYPVRFMATQKIMDRAQVSAQLFLNPALKNLVIIGGSQGSVFINDMMKELVCKRPEMFEGVQIIHQTGAADKTDWHTLYQSRHIKAIVFDYCEDMLRYYVAADLVISRAGAGTLFELLFLNKQTVIIPLEIKTNTHQLDNAQQITDQYPHLFTVLRQRSVEQTTDELAGLINIRLKNMLNNI